jgi:hypothetical protein
MRNARRAVGFVFGIVLVGVGCGDGTGTVISLTDPKTSGPSTGGGSPIKSVSSGKRFDELTPDERMEVCNDVTEYFMTSGFDASICRFSGWLTAALQADFDPTLADSALRVICEQSEAQCVAEGATTVNCAELPQCPATVAEFNDCLTATVEAIAAVPACGTITRQSLAVSPVPSTQPAVCMALEAKCPSTASVMSQLRAAAAARR